MRLALVALVVGGACRANVEHAPCASVAARFYTITRSALDRGQLDESTRRGVVDRLPAMAAALDEACQRGAWSAAVRDCMANAEDRVGVEACERELTDLQRAALDAKTTSP